MQKIRIGITESKLKLIRILANIQYNCWFYRTNHGVEADLVLERKGKLYFVEIINYRDFLSKLPDLQVQEAEYAISTSNNIMLFYI